jgi:hypothetical protein
MIAENLVLPVFFDSLHERGDYFTTFRYDIFQSHFESLGYKIVTSQTTQLSWNEINQTRVAFFWAPCLGFTASEVDSILRYVSEGKDVILLLDGWMPNSINQLTNPLGVEVFPGSVIAQNHLWDEGSFPVSDFREHPITDGITNTEANWIAPMKTLGNATTLAYTSNDTWTSENPGIVGPFAYMTVSSYGLGKVLIIADNLFMDCESHLKMLHNAVSWFTGDYWLTYVVDLNRDGKVNILDITIVARAYGGKPGSINWNEIADIDQNGLVNILDIAMIAKDYGKTV